MSEEMNVAAPAAENTAQTSGQAPQTAAAVGGRTDVVNDATFQDDTERGEGTPSGFDGKNRKVETGKKPQSKDTNAEFARKRREQERQRELTETRNQAIIDALGGRNPYTGGEMTDAEDVAEFLTMREIEKTGGDPVTDYSGHVKARVREQREQERTEAEQRAWYEKDRADFFEKYPDADLSALIDDEDFNDYSEGKVGEVPLAEIYEGFLRMTARIEEHAKRMAAQMVANGKASPGALTGAAQVESDYISADQVKAKRNDPKWIKANYGKIRASMAKW
ncbi:MAG: hypothetical protein J6B09_06585 [Clostridia bacterium]|nr:hypothetical protein [Clostridia bacterium]